MKILIVEDEPSLREIMYRALVQEHYVVETAATYAEADAKVAGYSYDCILLDIMLPDGNGLRLLEHIKELRKRENVIIISARNSLEDKVLGLEQGADDYLPKPFHTAELLARIRSVLRRGRSGGVYGDRNFLFSDGVAAISKNCRFEPGHRPHPARRSGGFPGCV